MLSDKFGQEIRQLPEIVKIVWLLTIPVILLATPIGVIVLWLFVTTRK